MNKLLGLIWTASAAFWFLMALWLDSVAMLLTTIGCLCMAGFMTLLFRAW